MPYTKPSVLLLVFLFCYFLLLSTNVNSRYHLLSSSSSDIVISEVVQTRRPANIGIDTSAAAEEVCEDSYGFLPCTNTVLGNLFLIFVYGRLMFEAATYVSSGSELLLEIIGPGIIGGSLLPLLGDLPESILILVSGLSGSKTTAQRQVSIGMGMLAGSTIMLLTATWGTCILVGRCDIRESDSLAIDEKNEKGFHLTGTGVSIDIWTCYAARIMVISVFPFLVVQIPEFASSTSGRSLEVLIALIVSLAMLISYFLYQIFRPWVQRRRLEYAKLIHVISGILKHLGQRALGKLTTDDGEPNKDVLHKLFSTIDQNGDGHLSASELRALIVGIRFEEIDLNVDDAVANVLRDFDLNSDGLITVDEFILGISKWLSEAQRVSKVSDESDVGVGTMKFIDHFHKHSRKEHTLLGPEDRADDQSEEAVDGIQNPRKMTIKAVVLLLLGAIIAAVFADPLVDALDNFSSATGIPIFFASFVALPMATKSGEFVSAVGLAWRKKLKTASLTFSELYNVVTMTNLRCLSVFFALVYIRGLTWNFSSEVLVIFIVCIVMGLFASFRTTFPLWTSGFAYLLYPSSLALVYVLDYRFGWS